MKTALPVVVTSTVLNAERYVGRCIRSVREQTFQDWKHIIVDAKSDDATFNAMVDAARMGGADTRTELVAASDRRPVFANLLPIWRDLPDETIIVWVDGDDWLATDYALARVLREHEAGAWVTYGQFMWRDGRLGFAAPVGTFPRAESWRATHLKTFRAGLVKAIRDEDFRTTGGEYCPYATDRIVMLPCLEMAAGKAAFIPEILYVYNDEHSMEHAATDRNEFVSREYVEVKRIHALPAYKPVRL